VQGDIKPPKLQRFRPLSKPKPTQTHLPSQPDEVINEAELSDEPAGRKRSIPKPHEHINKLWEWWKILNWKERLGVIGVSLLVVFAVGVIWIAFFHPSNTPSVALITHTKPKPKVKTPITAASPLTGLQVDPALASRPVTGIMIENSDFARPQSGLQDAGVVYEAIAEGGITRFLALYQEGRPAYIGPVRSLRPYFIDFAAPFQASIVHVGGSPEALSTVRNGNYRDLDQFFNSGAFMRIGARAAPHNVYTNFDKLDALNQAKGYTTSSFTIWPRKADKKLAAPTARTIDIAVSSPDYYSRYTYDAASNTYQRSEGGAPHMELVSADDRTGVQIHPKVVIALVMAYGIEADGKHSDYGDTGSGTAYVFQDGGVAQGHWVKADSASQIQFTDANNVPLKLDAGQTWLTLVGDSSKVKYAP
jgi:hypothetical protein